ncbi:hypothetical protein [Phenylobacterium deserti]|uniref:hypothetical protein n=1 Tax=Phenylobacterium deserti TaxID=1914756 RepID=UPI0014027A63|nr:hypothetical protein [Phenylobacterium deserti]
MADALNIYTFIGLRNDGSSPQADFVYLADDDLARGAARRWLQEHASCDAAEIWNGARLVGKIRALAGPG